MGMSSADPSLIQDLPRPGDRIQLDSSPETFKVYEVRPLGEQLVLGVISTRTGQALNLVLTLQEVPQRVRRLPTLEETFRERRWLPRDPFLLFVEALRMRLAYTFDPHYAVSVTQVDLLPHQVEAVYGHILPLLRIRFLLADDPGLGKTIMAGLVLKELKARDSVRSCLIIVPAHLQDQWRREMWDWFREDFTVLERHTLDNIYSSPDFFERNPQLLTSMDFAKREGVREVLARRRWDLVIVDEAHKFSAARYGKKVEKTQRYRLGEAISPVANHLLFLTATPHKGDDFAYFSLLSLLEPHLFANPQQLKEAARTNGLPFVLRRSKEEVKDLEGRPLFKRREVITLGVTLTHAEQELYEAVTAYVRRWYGRVEGKTDRRSRNIALALTLLQRRLSSSLAAIRESLRRRRRKLRILLDEWERRLEEADLPTLDEESLAEIADASASDWESFQERLEGLTAAETPEELKDELEEIEELIKLAEEVEKAGEESKVQELRRALEEHLRHHPDEKLVVFTEFKDTLRALEQKIRAWGFSLAIIHGGMNLQARIDQERFFRDQAQVMVATDAAGEGINLQFCHLMINYDLPWNPNRLEQRMGRIHRYGQKRDCFIWNLVHRETKEGQVLQRLMEKLELMKQRLGNSVYDVVGQLLEGVRLEELIMQAVLKGDTSVVDRVIEVDLERRFEEYHRALEENALAGHHIDLSAILRDDAESRRLRLVPYDVEFFTRLALPHVGGSFVEDKAKGVFRISVPKEFARRRGLQDDQFFRGLRIAFERKVAKDADAEFFAPGHPLLEALCDHFLEGGERPRLSVLADPEGQQGVLWLFRCRIKDGFDRPVLERLIALFQSRRDGSVEAVDPRWLRNLSPVPTDASIPEDAFIGLEEGQETATKNVISRVNELLREAQERRKREVEIKRRWLERSFEALIAESTTKLFDYHRRRDLGEDMRIAIQQEEANLKALLTEREKRLQDLTREEQLTLLEPELEAVAVVIPVASLSAERSDEEARRAVEKAGMDFVMRHEEKEGRKPVDVSAQRLGYDIISSGPEGTRYIEVKAFATTGPLEVTPHEWQMAQRLGKDYWLYVVEDALTQPRLTTIQDPINKLEAQQVWEVVKILITKWKEA